MNGVVIFRISAPSGIAYLLMAAYMANLIQEAGKLLLLTAKMTVKAKQ